jgi:hypothetical protein
MRRSLILSAFIVAAAMTGCTTSPTASYVSEVSATDANVLASSIAEYLGQHLPPAGTVLALQPPQDSQANNPLTPALSRALRSSGFGVAELSKEAQAPAGSHPVRYLVTPMYNGFLIRVRYDRTNVSRWFARNTSGNLQPASPYSVQRGGQ